MAPGCARPGLALALVTLLLAAPVPASALLGSGCRNVAAARAASLYGFAAKQFRNCSRALAAGKSCDTARRDAKVSGKLAKTQIALLGKCTAFDGTSQGFADADGLVVSVAGAANGEGRQVADSVFGRNPSAIAAAEVACAAAIANEVARAGKSTIKDLIRCGTTPVCQAAIDPAWQIAELRAAASCPPAALVALLGVDLATHFEEMRAGAERVAGALRPSFDPSVSVAQPAPAEILTPPSLPFDLAVRGFVANVPHAGYVNSFEIDGEDAAFDPLASDFGRTVNITAADAADLTLVLRARTTLGTVSSTAPVNVNLGSLAPDVVITSPISGTINAGSSITVSGQVIGQLAEADVLLVGGQVTSFNPTTGAFSRSVPLGSTLVQFIEAEVVSVGLGTSGKDSVVVLKGTPWPMGQRVPGAIFGRLNDSGFADVRPLVAAALEEAFDPNDLIGLPLAGGVVCGFNAGDKSVDSLQAAGANTIQLELSVEDFHIEVCDIGLFNCDLEFDATELRVTAQADLEDDAVTDDLKLEDLSLTGVFDDPTIEASGGLGICDLGELLNEVPGGFEEALPELLVDALRDLEISDAFSALGVDIDTDYDSVTEDATGTTFRVDANITALDPVPDAPIISHTLLPSGVSPPVLGPTIPSTSTSYDLGFCLSDGFVNRATAAFMQQGRFNQSIDTVPGTTLPLQTELLDFVTQDEAYGDDCPGCPVTLVLKPTAAAVARAPQVGEDGTVTLIVPNYRVDVVVDDGGTPRNQLSALVTFTLPIELAASGTAITPSAGTLSVDQITVTQNPIGADESLFAATAADLFPDAAAALAGVFASIELEPFQGLDVTPRGASYNVSCTALYVNLS